ncbi:putative nADH dehydrogenase [Mycobacterium kansasii]|uniref:NADH:ubiquinone reductase (non-electrogenic) n=1 Tax=Mycobacterium kansasii TaxID=1768 RepID=A0A1V3WQI0_MYCKA|nr:putative nADH dehydrogenase [Mycobacterium kansasii]
MMAIDLKGKTVTSKLMDMERSSNSPSAPWPGHFTITPSECRVILLDAAPSVLPPMGPKLGLKAQHKLEKMDVEVQLNAMVTAVDYQGITVKDNDGTQRRIECARKVWAAGVQASRLGKMIAEQSEGTEVDRAGRVIVEPDLTVKGHPYVFVIGDLMSVPGVPGMAQGAIQGARYATTIIKHAVKSHDDPASRKPFQYFNKGSMTLISHYSVVAKIGNLEFAGFIVWLAVAAPDMPGGPPQSHRRHVLLGARLPRPHSRPDGHH